MTSEHCGGQRDGRVICTQLLAIKAELATQAEIIYAACFAFKTDDACSDAICFKKKKFFIGIDGSLKNL